MEERDFIKREIEKIGVIMRAIWGYLFGGKDRTATTIGTEVVMSKDMLKKEMNFDVDEFLLLDESESIEYLKGFEGLDFHNQESLADILAEIGNREEPHASKLYLGKALFLYELITKQSQTYSFEREEKAAKIRLQL